MRMGGQEIPRRLTYEGNQGVGYHILYLNDLQERVNIHVTKINHQIFCYPNS